MRFLLCILFISSLIGCFAQKKWEFQFSIPLDSTSIWEVDGSNNAYVISENLIKKYDIKGKLWGQQSIKSIGTIEKIDARNPLKIVVFSEDQQRICYLDNALAVQKECIELNDYDVQLATTFSSSIQTDRVWIYDQLNSEIQLITLRNSQKQSIQNIKGLVDLGEITELIEYNNELFIVDTANQIARFDNFGNFIDVVSIPTKGTIKPADDFYMCNSDYSILLYGYDGLEKEVFFMDNGKLTSTITDFQYTGTRLYISTLTEIYCFELN